MNTDPGAGPTLTSGGGGRPDERFPSPVLVEPAERQEVTVSVVATVNLSRNQGKIRFVNPIPNGRTSGIEERGQAALRAVGTGDQLIREYPVRVNLSSDLTPNDDREGLVSAVLPLASNTRAIELSVAGHIADAVRVGGSLPSLRGAQRLIGDDGKALRIGLALDGPLDESHTYSVQISDDQGKTWRTVGVGLREPVFELDQAWLHKGATLQVRVIATNGLSSVIVTTDVIRV